MSLGKNIITQDESKLTCTELTHSCYRYAAYGKLPKQHRAKPSQHTTAPVLTFKQQTLLWAVTVYEWTGMLLVIGTAEALQFILIIVIS